VKPDRIAKTNQRHWEDLSRSGIDYTIPWLDLDPALVRAFVAGEIEVLPEPYA
jgi:hypothetical protein